jgi:O-antigen/teichoic acid export membrane protein
MVLPKLGEWPWVDEVRPYALAVGFLVGGTVMRDMATVLPQLYRHTRFLMALNLAIDYGGAMLGLALVARGWGAAGLLWGAALGTGVGAGAGLRYAWRLSTPSAGWDLQFVRVALSVGAPLFGIATAQWAVQGVDRLFLAHYHGAATVGVYGLASGVASGILAIAATVNLLFLPVSASLRATPERLRRFTEASLRLTIVALGLCVAGAFLAGPWVMRILAGPAYADGGRVLPWMVLSYALFTVLQLLQWIPMAIERRVAGVVACYATMAGVNVVLDLALIPLAGMKGAVIAAIAAQIGGMARMTMLARAALPFHWRPALPAIALLAGAACLATPFAISANAAPLLAIAATAALVGCYAGASLAIGAVRKDDLLLVRSALSLSRADRPDPRAT